MGAQTKAAYICNMYIVRGSSISPHAPTSFSGGWEDPFGVWSEGVWAWGKKETWVCGELDSSKQNEKSLPGCNSCRVQTILNAYFASSML